MDEDSHLDDLLKAVFRDEAREGESVLDTIERNSGAQARILLRDAPDRETPVLRPPDERSADFVRGDSRYQVLGELARGGIGVIQKGRDRNLGRSVALKVLRAEHVGNEDVVRRFIEEAQIGGQLQHPGIVPVYGLGMEREGRPYFAMRLVKGETLAARLEDRKEPGEDRRRFLGVFEHVAQTVAYAHARGVVHRDLKPSNVMIGRFGEVLVVDWGLAKVLGRKEPEAPETTIISTVRTEGDGSASLVGSVMGTPAYMPPEQALGHVESLDERSDVFALGAVLTEILTGEPPYTGDSKDQLVMAAQARIADALSRLDASGADEGVIALAKRCLEPVPGDRPRDAGVLAREIGEHLAEAEERARSAEIEAAEERAKAEEERERETRERHRVNRERAARRRALAIAVAVVLMVAAGGIGWALKDRANREREDGARKAVAAAMRGATGHLGGEEWADALAAARKAVALAETRGADDATKKGALTLLERIATEKRSADRAARIEAEDEALVATLKERWLRQDPSDLAQADLDFSEAFRELGADLENLSPDEAASWIRSRSMAVPIAVLVDYWARIRCYWLHRPREDWEWMVEVARRADPDPWRNRLRDAVLSEDLEELRQLAADSEDENLPALTLDLLGLLLGKQDPSAAAALLRRAQLEHPDDALLNLHLGQMLGRCKPPRYREALRFLTAGLALIPSSASAWDAVATDYSYLGDDATALMYERRAVELAPDWAPARNNLGAILSGLDLRQEAITEFRKAAEQTRNTHLRFIARMNLAKLLRLEGDYAGAIEAASEAYALEPDDVRAPNLLAWLHVACPDEGLRDIELAIRVAGKGAELHPENPNLRGTLGAALYRAGEFERAVSMLEEAMSLHKGHEDGLGDRLFFAMALWMTGREDEARSTLREAQEGLAKEREALEEDLRIRAEAEALIQGKGR